MAVAQNKVETRGSIFFIIMFFILNLRSCANQVGAVEAKEKNRELEVDLNVEAVVDSK
jgi:hypothetical protein